MFIEKSEIDGFIDKANELYKYIESKKKPSNVIGNVDNDIFLLYLYSNELIKLSKTLATQSKRLGNMTDALAILALGSLAMIVVSIFAYLS